MTFFLVVTFGKGCRNSGRSSVLPWPCKNISIMHVSSFSASFNPRSHSLKRSTYDLCSEDRW